MLLPFSRGGFRISEIGDAALIVNYTKRRNYNECICCYYARWHTV